LAIIPFVGIRFGSLAGLFTGLVGNAIVDQVQGFGFLTFWNWSLANGSTGVVAGLLAYYAPVRAKQTVRLLRVAVISALAVVVGLSFTITDVLLGSTYIYWLTAAYLPAVVTTGLLSAILTPALDSAWQPLADRAGR
jgi:uncharacterized membrane protein